ncbi:AmmeMemoRadiSam system protein A [Hahella sp. SMD15-11]|uniref:AmmeMemoRadiSam system protein A n=1 Tax=Thermohahella caldifontis TaxID=3142973 RepID=A0AB39V1G1_9GAMM
MAPLLSSEQLERLCWLAARSIEAALSGQEGPVELPEDGRLHEPGASFVTLTRSGNLRGCIGSLQAWRPLWEDVWENARAAAFRDPRFPPLSAAEWRDVDVEVSVLTPPRPLPVSGEAELRQRLQPGKDGVILSWRGHRATFLPDVWAQLPDPAEFLAHLKRKAGLPEDFWAPDMQVQIYGTQKAWLAAANRT